MVVEVLGLVGSPTDVVVLGYLIAEVRFGVLPRVQATEAAVTATARQTDGVDGDRVASETDPDRQDVQAMVTDGGERR